MPELHFVTWKDRTYHDQTVSLDNHQFVHCWFERVTFLYSGGPWKIESDCHLGPGCTVLFQGATAWTVLLVESLKRFGVVISAQPPRDQEIH